MTTQTYEINMVNAWLPANVIQAQRNYFGAHTYERIDAKGTFIPNRRKGEATWRFLRPY